MKMNQKGVAPIVIAIMVALLLGVGGYAAVKQQRSKKSSASQISDQMIVNAENKTRQLEFTSNTKGHYNAVPFKEGSYGFSIVAKGDIDNDGYQDAVVSEVSCGASCGNNLGIIINDKNGSAYILDVAFPGYITSGAGQTDLKSVLIDNGIISVKANGFEGDDQNYLVPGYSQTRNFKFIGNKLVLQDQSVATGDWKTYTNEKFGFEIKYPADYFIYDYGVIPDTAVTAAVIGITDSKKTYDSTSNNKVVVYVSKLPVGFKNSEEYLKYMHASYPAMREIKVTKENRVDLGGVEGLQFFGVQKDSETGREANIQSILGYSDKTGYEVVSWSSDFPLFSTILSTFKLTEKDSLIVPTSEQQSVINYLQANITKMIKAKPVLGATKWSFYQIAFYPANKVLVSFEDGHITGGFLGSYSMNDGQVSVTYIAEVINTGDEDKKLSEKYNLTAEVAVKFKYTSGSGFELIK